ncbi:hypothetical protein [Sinorhizobium fredii]|uniref:ATP dependent DNA ligase n=1 Tax=Rhizobium fredii TaxID=380 RepID=UPI0004BA1EE6
MSTELRKLLESIATKATAVNLKLKNAVFVEPRLVAEVEYTAGTGDGKLRHPSFNGIRERADDATAFEMRDLPAEL